MKEILLNGSEYRKMPKAVRQQCVWLVKDYERLQSLAKRGIENSRFGPYEIVLYADEKEGLIPSGVVENAMHKVRCIDLAMEDIPLEYRKGIISNIMHQRKYDSDANLKTWEDWKEKFLNNLAKKLELC